MRSTSPTVSLIIPCRNEVQHIASCLRSVLTQEVPVGDFEVIVADGMSTDGTRDLLTRFSLEEPRLRVIDNPQQNTPCGMNVGIKAAQGRFIAIMGAHNRYAPDYVSRSVEVLEATGADNVGGAMRCEASSYTQQAIAAAYHSPFSAGGARWHDPEYEGLADTVFGGVYRREVFERIGFFDEEFIRNQDDEFNLRLTRAGGKIWHSPQVQSWYTPRSSLRALFRQYHQYGYWKVRVIKKHRLPASVRHLVPGAFVLAVVLLPFIGLWWPVATWGWLGLLGLYLASTFVASARTAARYGWHLLPILPAVFACYHFAYGYGFLRGLWDFVLWRSGPHRTSGEITRTTVVSSQ